MVELMGVVVFAMAGLIVGGAICGIVALFRIRALRHALEQTRSELNKVLERFQTLAGDVSPAAGQAAMAPGVDVPRTEDSVAPIPPVTINPSQHPVSEVTGPSRPVPSETGASLALEMRMGTRWIIWLGAVIFLGGVAWALKYTYDNNLVGPVGRILLGVLTGIALLFTGEYYSRRRMHIPFQAFTGAGLAILYLCVFFSFQVYQLSGAGISMLIAVGITALAISLSVVHNALPIALLAVTGGFMSPVFLSTGQNAPWLLFTYVAVLNLVALGAAFFRRWRALDLFCLAGTSLLYMGWHNIYFKHPDELVPALTFITLFYGMFLAAPMVYGLSRRIPEGLDSLALIISNSIFWLFCYYEVFFPHHRAVLGYVVLGQAVLVFLLYVLWIHRVKKETQVAVSLLGISLALLTLVFPLLLRFDLVPVAWAVQGSLLLWLSFRFDHFTSRAAGVLVFLLAIMALVLQLPLHTGAFTPVINPPFGTWAFVITALSVAAAIAFRWAVPGRRVLAGNLALAALGLACWLLTMETYLYWTFRGGNQVDINRTAALVFLWTVIPLLLVLVARLFRTLEVEAVSRFAWVMGFAILLFSFMVPRYRSDWLLLNLYAAPKLVFIGALWWSVARVKCLPPKAEAVLFASNWHQSHRIGRFLELTAHAALALLAFAEMVRWGRTVSLISVDMAIGMVSALWALHACMLTWHGLVSRQTYRRYAGILLFALAVVKTVFIDAFNLAGVYRIVSWLGVGILLVIAALLYQRYSALLLAEEGKEASPETDGSSQETTASP